MKQTDFAELYTPEGECLAKEGFAAVPWNTYPRPQLKRDSFLCLNGAWTFKESSHAPETILVPFPPESLLSGIGRRMGKCPCLRYRRLFTLPDGFRKDRVILHFGAVDQAAAITLNGKELGTHKGGYEAFSFDITDFLAPENTLEVTVTDELDTRILPYGKQCEKRGSMWYTPVTGIWQTVWLESVPEEYIRSVDIRTDADSAEITAEGITDGEVSVVTPDGTLAFPLREGKAAVRIPSPRLWSPEDPWLYRFTIRAGEDTVESYFALRTLSVRNVNGIPRLCLNGKPYFFHGLLDQGYWSDGLFTPASSDCFEKDILAMKNLGFNTLRKHIKVEPEAFYYACDRLGMIVFQDMVNNGDYSFVRDTALPTAGLKRLPDKRMHRNPETRAAFITGMESTVKQLRNHPCVCYWTIFNEGWGQFDSAALYRKLKALDGTRFIDTASGWFSGAPSDVESPHVYFKPVRLNPSCRPLLLSEFGGYSYRPKGHIFNPDRNYGYRSFGNQADFEDALEKLYLTEIVPAAEKGLCGAIYTQVSDVEDETNGLVTYDRKVTKVSADRMRKIAARLRQIMQALPEE